MQAEGVHAISRGELRLHGQVSEQAVDSGTGQDAKCCRRNEGSCWPKAKPDMRMEAREGWTGHTGTDMCVAL